MDTSPPKSSTPQSSCTYDEAMVLIGSGRYQYFLLLVCGLSLMSVTIESLNPSFTMPFARCDLQLTPHMEHIISASGFVGLIVSSHAWGFLVDTWGRVKVLRVALSLCFVFSLISSLSVFGLMIAICRLLVGVGLAGLQTASIVYMGEFCSNADRPFFVTMAAMFLPLGTAYQPMMAYLILPLSFSIDIGSGLIFTAWRFYIIVSTMIVVFTFTSFMLLPESPKFLMISGRQDEAMRVLRRIYAHNSGQPPETFPVLDVTTDLTASNIRNAKTFKEVLALMWNQTWPLFVHPYRWRILLLFYLMFVVFLVAHGFYMSFPVMFELYLPHKMDDISICDGLNIERNITLDEEIELFSRPVLQFHVDQFIKVAYRSSPDYIRLFYTEKRCPKLVKKDDYILIAIMGSVFVGFYLFVLGLMNFLNKRYIFTCWITMNAIASFAITFTKEHNVNMTMLTIMASGASCGSAISAIAADAFPSSLRGMALCLIMMMCRVGAIFGNIAVTYLIFEYCTALFVLCGILTTLGAFVNFVLMQNPENKLFKCV